MMSRGCLLRLRKLRIEQRLHKPTEILAETTRKFPEHFTTHRVHARARMYVCVRVYSESQMYYKLFYAMFSQRSP